MIVLLLVTLKKCKFSWIISYLKFLEESFNNLIRKEMNFKIIKKKKINIRTAKQKIKVFSLEKNNKKF